MISSINNAQNVVFVVNCTIKLKAFFIDSHDVYILQEMDFRFLLVTNIFGIPVSVRFL